MYIRYYLLLILPSLCSGNLSKNQLSSLKALKLVFLYGTLKVFVSWIASGYYDFCELPYSMKVELLEATKLKLEMIPSDWFGEWRCKENYQLIA